MFDIFTVSLIIFGVGYVIIRKIVTGKSWDED